MNLTINTKFNPSIYFTAKKSDNDGSAQTSEPISGQDTDGMSASEISGRIRASMNSKNQKRFNMKTAYRYFSRNDFKDVPEYIEAGKKAISKMTDYDKGNQLDTTEYQEKLADKIVGEEPLISNQSIRDSLFEIVTGSNNVIETDFVGMTMHPYLIEKTGARLKVLDAYAKNEDMQNNDAIRDNIGPLVLSVRHYDQADLLVSMLEKNKENNDKDLFRVLGMMFRDGVPNEQIGHVGKIEDVAKHVGYGMNYLKELDDLKKKPITINTSHLKYCDVSNVVPKVNIDCQEYLSDYAKENLDEFLPDAMEREKEHVAEVIKNSKTIDEVVEKYSLHVSDLFGDTKENGEDKKLEADWAVACSINKSLKGAFPKDRNEEMSRVAKKVESGEFYFSDVPEDLADRVNAKCFKPEFADKIKKDRENSVGIPLKNVYSSTYRSMLTDYHAKLVNVQDKDFYFDLMRKHPNKEIENDGINYRVFGNKGGMILYTHEKGLYDRVRQFASDGTVLYERKSYPRKGETKKQYYSYGKNPITEKYTFYKNTDENGFVGQEEVVDSEILERLNKIKDEVKKVDKNL